MRLFWKFSLIHLIEQGQRKRERRKQDKKNYKSLYRRRGIVLKGKTKEEEMRVNWKERRKTIDSFSFTLRKDYRENLNRYALTLTFLLLELLHLS